MNTGAIGKFIILMGIILVVVGGLFLLMGKIPFIGRLPGDIYIQKKNFHFYFPIVTCLLISFILTLILSLIFRR